MSALQAVSDTESVFDEKESDEDGDGKGGEVSIFLIGSGF